MPIKTNKLPGLES